MKAADEPAYLTVGTDVSAKYRGAFCEAKIKTVKRLVKVKVTVKGESTSQVVQDDQVKGHLRVGSTVEVRTNEGVSSEAVISKLTDASLYTVVFDDGDEKTLRRTSLCLKGERHFAESETLDQLPLTNPEHFGTPVIGKKSNRGGRRSSQAAADEDHVSSSSEDEDDELRKMNDELLGKVCSIEEDEDKHCWFLALVVSPSCNEEHTVRKDQCLVRSFADGKFFTVVRRHVHIMNSMSINKSEFILRRGSPAARCFMRDGDVPQQWKVDMSQILDSSSSEEDEDRRRDSEEEQDQERRRRIKEEPEEELDPVERDHFLQQLYKFMEDRGTSINKPPVLGYKDLNLFKLFRLVYQHGGYHKIESGTVWKQVYIDLGIPVLNSAASYNVKTAYKKYLYGFEEYCRSASITFRTIHHNNPRPPPPQHEEELLQVIEEPPEHRGEESDSESDREEEEEERQTAPRGRKRCVSRGKTEREKRGGPEGEQDEEPTRRRSNRRMDDSERGSEEEEEEEDEEDEEAAERRREERTGDDDDDSVTGTKVRVKYGRGKTQKIYEAHIKKTDVDNGDNFYLVHYYGWNVRYDEWVKGDRIIWPPDRGTKKRSRRSLMKEDGEKDEDRPSLWRPTPAKRGRPQSRHTPPGGARSLSRTPGSDPRPNRRSDGSSNMSNGDNSQRRRSRRTSGVYDSDRSSNDDSGNSADDSESEDPPDKKPSPWRGRSEAPPTQAEEAEPNEDEEEEEEEMTREVADVTVPEDVSAVMTASPSIPQEDGPKEEKEQGEESVAEAPVSPPPDDVRTPLEQEVAEESKPEPRSPERCDKHDSAPSSPQVKGCRVKVREVGSETPPTCTLSPTPCSVSPTHTAVLMSSPRAALKRQDEPMVVLHCLPRLPEPRLHELRLPEPRHHELAASDTDSASEDEDAAPPPGPKPKTVEDKPCPIKAPPTGATEKQSEAQDWPVAAAVVVSSDETTVESELLAQGPVAVMTCPAPFPAPVEEAEPQMDPEALVCHEVDLDDLDEKEKPSSSSEPLLLMMSKPTSFLPELRPSNEERAATWAESDVSSVGGDNSGSASIHSLQDTKERGQKRLSDCSSSPSNKKQKRSQKRANAAGKSDRNGAGHSSDSDDHTRAPPPKRKSLCPGLSSPSSVRDKHNFSHRSYKWSFQLGLRLTNPHLNSSV
ncbi:AT-rich interactive domain-containing protein 4A isoform X3 [Gouania willdenowi]|uniref:AT-rich interactive domain-containing protein 4A isoform X3 n=1 Tax=Gouania willdenowi TaxID=441366 RepID=UPI0010549786|nr:AT-rich interactive domain-containing protein 4A isoform X3 [Gouania willdenowi]